MRQSSPHVVSCEPYNDERELRVRMSAESREIAAAGFLYLDSSQTIDDEVRQLLSSQGADATRRRSA